MNLEKLQDFKKDIYCGIIGEPKVIEFSSGKKVTRFGLALRKNLTDDATWLDCEAWAELGEEISLMTKGTKLLVIGSVKTTKGTERDFHTLNIDYATKINS